MKLKTLTSSKAMFAEWAGHNWKDSPKQVQALYREWIPYKAKLHERRITQETFTKYLGREAGFSEKYGNYQAWYIQKPRTTSYMIRIERYMAKHPNATLAEARGHGRRRR